MKAEFHAFEMQFTKQSGRNRYYLSPRSFLLGDREQERNFNFSLRNSIQKAKEQRLLQDYRIHVTPGVQPDPGQMATILRCRGAMVLPNMPRANKEKTLVISCAGDLPKCKAALNANIPVVDVEFALTGILQQAVDLGKYRLGSDEAVSHSKPQGKGRSLRSLATGSSPVPGGKRKKR
ncbi:mediator of DNA damage checkpoint protein 1-like [Rhinoraja longicauda]